MIKTALHATTWRLERLFALRQYVHRREAGAIDPYIGYATETDIVLRGRVLARRRLPRNAGGGSALANFIQIFKLFLTSEVAHVEVHSAHGATRTNEEGYFRLKLPRQHAPGWHEEDVILPNGDTTPCPFFVPDADAPAMIISDIDDTVLKTRAWSLMRNLWTTFTGTIQSREMHLDAIDLYGTLQKRHQTPIFYVSSSPWNLHGFLTALFKHTSLPTGPMFLRDLGVDRDKFITSGHGSHKGDSIDRLMQANPGLPAILCGDTGQHDARIYLDAIRRHPGRVKAVILRTPGPGLDAADEADLTALRDTGIPVFAGRDFMAFADDLQALLHARLP